MEKKRLNWVDVARGIFMISIVWGHVYNNGNLRTWLYSFHVPAFFFISGYVSNNSTDNLIEFVKKRFKTIMVPYYFFSMISIIFWGGVGKILPKINDIIDCNILHNIGIMIYGNSKPDLMKYNTPLWFLPCLFSTSFIVFLFVRFSRKRKNKELVVVVFIFLCFVGGLFFKNHENVALPFHFETAISMSVWYMLGIVIREKKIVRGALFYNRSKKVWFLLSMTLILCGMIMSYFNTCVVGVRNEHYGIAIIYYFAAFFGIIGWIIVSVLISHNSILEYIGRNTIGILGYHKFFIIMFQTLLPSLRSMILQQHSLGSIFIGAIISIIAIMGSLILMYITSKIIPLPYSGYE